MTMKRLAWYLGATALTAAGAAGRWLGHPVFAPYAAWFLTLGPLLLGLTALRSTYYRSGSPWPRSCGEPQPLRFTWLDYLKVPVCWFDGFKRTYAVAPGLYYTGSHYDREAPLLVTANYHLTVLLVARRVRAFNARLLIVDTDGINVWCAASKGQLSDTTIRDQLERYDRELLTGDRKLRLILPKLSLAGVRLQALHKAGIHPVIGPIYARDLPAYLSRPPLEDCDDDRVVFGLRMRLFSWLPGLVQYVGYSLAAALVLFGLEWLCLEWLWEIEVPLSLIPLTALLGTAYPILFPWIPGHRFAVKGLWLAAMVSLGLGALTAAGWLSLAGLVVAALFVFATALFVGLSYTGNSAVSNYSAVRREIAWFLPLNVVLYLACLAAFIWTEAGR